MQVTGDGHRLGDRLQANDNPSNAAGWQAVAEPVAVAGDLHSAVLSATGGPRFFRLSKP